MTDRDGSARWPAPAYTLKQASSYDRASANPADAATWFANNDSGQFIRVEEHESRREWVIMEHDGPGAITRIWLPLEPSKEKQIVRFYLDGSATPAVAVPFNELLSGRGFVKPPFAFVASDETDLRNQLKAAPKVLRGVGGDFYLPIPFARGCKITLDEVPFYYIINYRAYEPGVSVESFSMAGYDDVRPALGATTEALLAAPDFSVEEPGRRAILAPGEELALGLAPGTAALRNLRVRIDPKDAPQALRSTVLTAEFDGEPTIWCPVGEFFGSGARLRPVQDWFRTVKEDGVMFARWTMPYRRSARLALKNLGSVPVSVTIAASTEAWKWDERSMLFHANWHCQSAIKTRPLSDWNYIEIHGSGVYVGDTLTAFNPVDPWYGEGDERVYLDGEALPSHNGTGTEDYYGYAWGMVGFFNSPFISQPQRDSAFQKSWKGYTTTSRMRLLDGIPLRASLRLDMEISHHVETEVDYAVGTFWYARPAATHNRTPQPADAARALAVLTTSPGLARPPGALENDPSAGTRRARAGGAEFIRSLRAGKNVTVVTMGTSLTGGAWRWPDVMTNDWLNVEWPGQVTLFNEGVGASASSVGPGGNPALSGLGRLDAVLAHKPDVVFIEFVVNDAFLPYHISLEDSKKNLNAMVDALWAANPKTEIILQTMNSCLDHPTAGRHASDRPQLAAYCDGYREVAKARGLLLVDHYSNWLKIMTNDPALFDKLVPDRIHPQAEGYRQVLLPALKETLCPPRVATP